jgi:methionyl-tRNA synthetase
MLTVEGTKMSKSRGTFINAREFLEAGLDPEWLRYFYAANLGTSPSDIDLSLTEMKNRVNGELLGNIGNLANRALSVLWKQFGGKLAKITGWDGGYLRGPRESPEKVTFAPSPAEIWEMAKTTEAEAVKGYLDCDTRYAIQQIMVLSSMGNERLQRTQPWKLILENPEAAQRELTLAVNIARVCARLLAPVVPNFAAGVAAQTNAPLVWGEWAFLEDHQMLAEPKPLVRRMEDADVLKLASRFVLDDSAKRPRAANDAPKAKGEPRLGEEKVEGPKPAKAKAAPPPEPPAEIAFDQFAVVDLRAGKVLACEKVPKSDKLLKLTIDLGEAAPRTILSGIALQYAPEELVGKMVVVVANLAKKPIMKLESHGMVLSATGGAKGLTVLELPGDVAPGARVK